jgi:hypothetical protein
MVFDVKEADIFTDFSYEARRGLSITLFVQVRLEVDNFKF